MIELFWSQIQEDANPKNSVDLQQEQENKNHTDDKNSLLDVFFIKHKLKEIIF